MKKLALILLAILFVSSYSFSQPEQKDIIEKADLFLDMMEYETAINMYLKALSENPEQRGIRKEIGYAYFQLKKYDEALKFLKEELTLFKDYGDAYDLLVAVFSKCDRIQENLDYLESFDLQIQVPDENPNTGLGDFIIGKYFKDRRNFKKARIFFRKALERGHDQVKCYVQLIDVELIQVKLDFARKVLREAAKKFPDYPPEFAFINGLLLSEKMKSGFTINRFRSVIGNFKYAMKSKHALNDALFNLACISYNHNDFEKASENFKKLFYKEPENAQIKFYLDCSLKKLSKSADKESLSECPKIINLSREFIDKPDTEYKYQLKNDVVLVISKINSLALGFVRKGEMLQAIKRYYNGLIIYPESPEINYNLGMVYFMQNNFKEAEKHAIIALRREDFFTILPDKIKSLSGSERREYIKKKHAYLHKAPDIPLSQWTFEVALKEGNYFLEAYDLLGNVYFKTGDFDKSLLAFKKDIEISHEDAMGHYNLGCAYRALNDHKNAEKEWKKAIKYEKESKRMKERGKISEGQLDISLIVFKRPVSFRAHKSLGWLYLDQSKPDKALKEFRKAIKFEPGDPEPYYELGKIYEAKSEFNEKYVEKAIVHYEKYLYLGGEKEEEVKKILKALK